MTTTSDRRKAQLFAEYGIDPSTPTSHRRRRGAVDELRPTELGAIMPSCPCPHPAWMHRRDGACQSNACPCGAPARREGFVLGRVAFV